MLRSVLTSILVLLSAACLAQSPGAVRITEHGTAAQTVKDLRRASAVSSIKGFRVRIFFDNGQNARAQATQTLNDFQTKFPGIQSYMSYDAPYWKVTVGNCTTKEEALMLKGVIEGSFNRAFVYGEDIAITKFAE